MDAHRRNIYFLCLAVVFLMMNQGVCVWGTATPVNQGVCVRATVWETATPVNQGVCVRGTATSVVMQARRSRFEISDMRHCRTKQDLHTARLICDLLEIVDARTAYTHNI